MRKISLEEQLIKNEIDSQENVDEGAADLDLNTSTEEQWTQTVYLNQAAGPSTKIEMRYARFQ